MLFRSLIKLAKDETLVGLERVQEPSEDDSLEAFDEQLGDDLPEGQEPLDAAQSGDDGDAPAVDETAEDDAGDDVEDESKA